jgi:Mg/Co/Ni transporter MgtE
MRIMPRILLRRSALICREVISSMNKEKVAELMDKMTPCQAADVLSVLPLEDHWVMMNFMDERNL